MSSFDLTDGKERLSLVRASSREIYFKQLPQNITWNIKQSTVKIIRPHVDLFLLTKMMTYQPHFSFSKTEGKVAVATCGKL